jgi:NAD(P)-dependent dehydrogenase (short-subunit alcohol dehydrogenase family)
MTAEVLTFTAGRKVSVVPADISKWSDIEKAIETSVHELGSLNVSYIECLYRCSFKSTNHLFPQVMVANAGMCRIKPMVDITPEEWEQEIAINLTGKKSYGTHVYFFSNIFQARFINTN